MIRRRSNTRLRSIDPVFIVRPSLRIKRDVSIWNVMYVKKVFVGFACQFQKIKIINVEIPMIIVDSLLQLKQGIDHL